MPAVYPVNVVDFPARFITLGVTGQVISAGKAALSGWQLHNTGAAAAFVKLYNKATAATEAALETRIMELMAKATEG
jgi:hypothetical protein